MSAHFCDVSMCAHYGDDETPLTCHYCGDDIGPLDALATAVRDVCWKATPTGYDSETGDVVGYVLPKGAIHRLVAAGQSAGMSPSLRKIPPTEGGAT